MLSIVIIVCRFDIDWDNEDQPISFDEADLHFTKAKVKKAKPVGGFSGDVDTIGEPKFRQRERPSKGNQTIIVLLISLLLEFCHRDFYPQKMLIDIMYQALIVNIHIYLQDTSLRLVQIKTAYHIMVRSHTCIRNAV